MTYKYKAFISYRHLETDQHVASKVQTIIENYRYKGKKTWKLFRDTSELPTSGSLSDDIHNALEDSEFLIVICTPAIRQSRWCLEEIETFKALHHGSTDHILPVLVEGRPEDSFPEPLFTTTKHLIDPLTGKEITKEIETEPLAANIAAPTRKEMDKKLKVEVLRLIAPMAGVSFDELYNRKRRQAIRNYSIASSIIVAASLAFGIYNYYVNQKLEAQNAQIMLDSAKALNSQSRTYFDHGQIRDALETSLLTFERSERLTPVTLESSALLAEQIGAFTEQPNLPYLRLNHPFQIKDYYFLADGSRLLSLDNNGNIYLWDTLTGTSIKKWTASGYHIETNDQHLMNSGMFRDMLFRGKVSGTVYSGGTCYFGFKSLDEESDVFLEDDDRFILYSFKEIIEVDAMTGEEKLISDKGKLPQLDGSIFSKEDPHMPGIDKGYLMTSDLVKDETIYLCRYNDEEKLSVDWTDIRVRAFDNQDQLLWQYDDEMFTGDILGVGELSKELSSLEKDCVFIVYDKTLIILEKHTGEIIIKKTFEDKILDYYYNTDCTFYMMLANGRMEQFDALIPDATFVYTNTSTTPQPMKYCAGKIAVSYDHSKYIDLYRRIDNEAADELFDMFWLNEEDDGTDYISSLIAIPDTDYLIVMANIKDENCLYLFDQYEFEFKKIYPITKVDNLWIESVDIVEDTLWVKAQGKIDVLSIPDGKLIKTMDKDTEIPVQSNRLGIVLTNEFGQGTLTIGENITYTREGIEFRDACLYEHQILVFCSDYSLDVLDQSGNFIKNVPLDPYGDFGTLTRDYFNQAIIPYEDKLIVKIATMGWVVDANQMELEYRICTESSLDSFETFDTSRGNVLITNGEKVVAYPIYSSQELYQLARNMVVTQK